MSQPLRRGAMVETEGTRAGGGTHPPANNITLQLDQNLIAEPDPRPGREDARTVPSAGRRPRAP